MSISSLSNTFDDGVTAIDGNKSIDVKFVPVDKLDTLQTACDVRLIGGVCVTTDAFVMNVGVGVEDGSGGKG